MVKDWKLVKIGDLLDFKNGLNKGKDFFGSGTPIINYMDVYKKSGLHSADIAGKVSLDDKEIKRYEVKKGDVFFTRTSETPEEVGIASVLLDDIDSCVFSGFVLRGRPKTDMLLPAYCKYCFSTHEVRQKIIANCTYTTRALTNGTQLSKIEILVPDKDEQFKIASSLTVVDQRIHKSEQLVKKYRVLKQACLQHMFPREDQIEPDVRLPGFTGPWEQRKLGDIVDSYSGGTPSVENTAYYGGNIPFIRSAEINNESTELFLTEAGLSNSSAKMVSKGDILYALYGATSGEVGIAKLEGAINQAILAILPHEGYNPQFIMQWLKRSKVSIISTYLQGGQGNLSGTIVKNLIINIPSYVEQVRMGEYFSDLDKLIVLQQRTCEKYKKIKQGMMEELLSGKVRLI